MLKTLHRATRVLHRVTPRENGDGSILAIEDDGTVLLRTRRGRKTARLHKDAFGDLVSLLEQFRFKRIAGVYGDALADYKHDLEVHEGASKKGRCTLRFNHEYGGFSGAAPPGIKEFLTLLDRLKQYLRAEFNPQIVAGEEFLDQLGRDIKFPYFNPHGDPGAFQLIDTEGFPVQASAVDWSMPYADGLIPFRDGRGLYGFMWITGEVIVAPRFKLTHGFSDGLAAVRDHEGWGYIGRTGEWVLKPRYTSAGSFSDGLAAVTLGDQEGFIDRDGDFTPLPPKVRQIAQFSGGLAAYQARNRIGEPAWGYLDHRGEIITKPLFETAAAFAEERAVVSDDGRYGYLWPDGMYAIEPRFEDATDFSEGYAVAMKDGLYGYIDLTGDWVIEPRFTEAGLFKDGLGLAPVKSGRHRGYIDRTGAMRIQPRFERAEPFAGGLAAVRVGDRWGFIEPSGAFVIEPRYESVRPFTDGVACVRLFAQPSPVVATGSSKVIINIKSAKN